MMRLGNPVLTEDEIFVVRHLAITPAFGLTAEKVTYVRTLLNTIAQLPVQMQSRLLHCMVTRVDALLNDYYHFSLEVKLQMARDNPKNMRWDELTALLTHAENERWQRFANEKQRALVDAAKNALAESSSSKVAATVKKPKGVRK